MPRRRALDSLEAQGKELVERLGGRWTASGGLCRCPAHDDRSPSLSVRVGRRSLLLHCFAGCTAADVLRALRAAGRPLDKPSDGLESGERLEGGGRGAARSVGFARRIWSDARPIAGTPAERYLASRGLRVDSAELRYHPRTP
ncbi:MAG TPA: hypothetical protein VF727_14690, partial [Allosphingosinicella sp.]